MDGMLALQTTKLSLIPDTLHGTLNPIRNDPLNSEKEISPELTDMDPNPFPQKRKEVIKKATVVSNNS